MGPRMKANVYVDGFNLYYGLLKARPYRWLNLAALARKVLPKHRVNRIRYFTALVQERDRPQALAHQQAYLRALATVPDLTIHYGHFLASKVWMARVDPTASETKVRVHKTEEKGSDVNLASYLLADAFAGDFELALVISNDSDLVTPIRMVANDLKLPVTVLNPHPYDSFELRKVASFHRKLRARELKSCQFPAVLQDRNGTISKPSSW